VESPLRTLVIARSPAEGSRLTYPLLRAGLKVGARRVAEVDELVDALRRGAPAGLDWELVVCPADGSPGVAAVGEAVRRSDREASIVAVELPGAALAGDAPQAGQAPADTVFLTADASGEVITQRVRREVEIGAMRRSARASAAGGDLRDRALASVNDAIVIADAAQNGFPTVYVNPAFERMTGWTQRQILGQSCAVLQGPRTDPEAIAELSRALAEGRELTVTLLNQRRDGSSFWNRVSLSPVREPDGSVRNVIAVLADVTEEVTARQRLEAARRDNARLREGLSEAEIRYRELVERIPAVSYVAELDEIGTIRYISPQVEQLLGYPPEAFAPPSELWYDLVHPDDRDRVLAEAARVFREGREYECEFCMVAADGREVHVWERVTIIRDDAGEPLFTQGVVVDITELRRAETALRDERDRAQRYLDVAGTIIVVLDRDERVALLNRAGHELLRFVEGQPVGRNWFDLCVPERDRAGARATFQALIAGRLAPTTESYENAVVTQDGEERVIMWHNTVLRDEDGEVTATLSSGLDITERRRADDRIAHLAYHDGLTGLPNRALLGMHLELAIARARRADRSVALVYLDLDDFKLVNDSFGHATGDDLLREVCSRLEARRRASDLLARQGGDEFLLLIADVDGDAYAVARAAAEGLLGTLAEPFSVQGSEFHLRASVGISVFPRDADDAETLLRHADAAMYQAKTAGRGGVRTWSGEQRHPFERLSMTTRLRRALDRDELVLHWQPIVAPATGALEGLEALVRWEDPDRGLVPPGDFIAVAEETGLIDQLGRWVLDAICRQRLAWRSVGVDPVVSFNVSPYELRRGDFAADVLDCVRRHGLEPEGLVMEITESTAMAGGVRTEAQLRELAAAGLRIAVDDFGAGASSLGRLQKLPVQILKLDNSFLTGVPADAQASGLVRAIVDLSAALDARLVVEGVETEAQRDFLVSAGCPLAQGFLLGRPAPAAELDAVVRAGSLSS
jgi:diguanylate cyclase (GGDEF)-like protein/PAS domain S-box-containing protein